MAPIIIYIFIGFLIVAGASVWFFFWTVKKARKTAYLDYADSLGFAINYLKKNEYDLSGNYRGYQYEILPFAPDFDLQEEWVRVRVPMTNPNKMYLRIAKGMNAESWLETFSQENSIDVKHTMGRNVELKAGDIFFSSLVLTDEMKVRIDRVFKLIEKGFVFIKDDELSAILPEGISKPEGRKKYKEVMNLLADIKDELNK